MSVFDDLLNTDICEAEDCGAEAFRHCVAGCGWRCAEHPCIHMPDGESCSWLSTDAVVSRMSDAELSSARLRLALQLQAIDHEMAIRRHQTQRRSPLYDLPVRHATKRANKSLLNQFIDSLSPKQVLEMIRKLKEKP